MSKGKGKVGLLNSGGVKRSLIFVILNWEVLVNVLLKLEGTMLRQKLDTGYILTSI